MKTPLVPLGAALGLALLLSGCETTGINSVDTRQIRIHDQPEVFAKLTPEQQAKITKGTIEVGYTADMVYLALGMPSKKKEKVAPEGKVEMWSYNTYHPMVTTTQVSLNNPGVRYQSFYNSNSFDDRAAATMAESGMAVSSAAFSSSMASTTGGFMTSLNLADLPLETVYVTLYNDKVIKISLEST